jgi:uncharacterized protein
MKRILSLDGGGIKGVFSIQVLASLEALLRREHRREDLVLADVFDLFAGTSTGAIIATCLAWGMSVHEIEQLYLDCAREIFTKERLYRRLLFAKYRAEPITRRLQQVFTETPGGREPALLGSSRLRTKLLVVMRNGSTGSSWPLTNNPDALFNDPARPDCNLSIPIWQLLRASTAAPSYFPPEEIRLGEQSFLFLDGGMTPFNNPTLIAVFMATLPCYRLGWPASRQDLHVVSVGTCNTHTRLPHKAARALNLKDIILYLGPAFLSAMSDQQDFICRVLGDCVHGAPLDTEVHALDTPSLLSATEQKFTYVRYDHAFDAGDEEGQRIERAEGDMDDLTLIPLLQQMGRDYATRHVRMEHLFPRGQER